MFRNKRFWLLALALCVVVVGGYAYYRTSRVVAQTGEEAGQLQTATVRVGSLVVSATGAGTIIPAKQWDLSFQQSGTVTEVLVTVGETVEAGQVLARLDDTAAQEAVAMAEQALVIQESSLATLTAAPSEDEVAAAEATLRSAEAALAQAQAGADPNEVAAAQATLRAASAALQTLLAGPDANSVAQATASLQKAEAALKQAQAAYDRVAWRSDIGMTSEALTLQQATIEYEAARAAYGSAIADPSTQEIAQAQAAVDQARASLVQLQNQTDQEASIASAQAQVAQARANLQALKTPATDQQIASAEAQVAQARISLEQARRELAQTELVAPIGGTVMAINAEVGETATNPFITLADLARPLVEVYLDETDLDKVAVGYEAGVEFDAFPDQTFTGHVVQVDPQLSVVNNVTTVRALVQLDSDSFARPQALPVGMNATIEVIGGRAEGALLVPVEALREIATGQYAVFVIEEGQPKLRPVKVGLMDFTFAEITEGLRAGEVVSTGVVETQ